MPSYSFHLDKIFSLSKKKKGLKQTVIIRTLLTTTKRTQNSGYKAVMILPYLRAI